ncbi:PQQ-binding-like beta-propeller repeat protein [Halorussus ruber]|uniref:PQQ-binding-like beta-propeller repeat protein n=1 Tax=Halorussus ruber TaxID=1126238 RepID=UPI0010932B4C|nr:PQQ-binding-like beta-propeller repeat protein [Halorussus ruber]
MPSSDTALPSLSGTSSRRKLLQIGGAALSASLAGCVGGALDRIYGFDAETGEQLWSHDENGAIRAPLSVADGVVYAGKLNGKLSALAETET